MLQDKVALISGASRGIGRGIASIFAKHGAFIGLNYNSDDQAAKKTLSLIKEEGGYGIILQGDISNREHVQNIVQSLINEKNEIDILIHNAGIYFRNDFIDISNEKWDKVLSVNLSGCYHLTQEVLPYMPDGGRIIFISSQLGFRGSPHGADYATTKAGMLGLMRSLALELANRQILVNAVAPGTIDTDIIAQYTPKQRADRIQEIPLKRLGTPLDIANACLFLASDLSKYITGTCIDVNGGLYIH